MVLMRLWTSLPDYTAGEIRAVIRIGAGRAPRGSVCSAASRSASRAQLNTEVVAEVATLAAATLQWTETIRNQQVEALIRIGARSPWHQIGPAKGGS